VIDLKDHGCNVFALELFTDVLVKMNQIKNLTLKLQRNKRCFYILSKFALED